MKKWLFLSFFMVLLVACGSKDTEEKTIPTNIRFEEQFVMWDAIEGATHYIVMVNNVSHTVYTNQLSMHEYPSNTYGIRVRAVFSETEQSAFSPTQTIVIERLFEHPKSLYVSRAANELHWQAETGATGYLVYVDETAYETTTNVFDLSILDEDEVYELSVKAVYATGVSEFSNKLWHHTYTEVVDTLKVTFNKLMGRDVRISIDEDLELHHVFFQSARINSALMQIVDDILIINHALIDHLAIDEYTFELITSAGKYLLELSVVAEKKPFMISSNSLTYAYTDIELEFELFGGTFESLSGQDITTSDYQFSNGTLTIYADFINGLLAVNPDRSTIIFSYSLKADEHITIGYIFIHIES